MSNQYNRVVTDLSNQEYHSDKEAFSNSQLSRAMKSASLIYTPIKRTEALRWGTLVHSIILEPAKFLQEVVVMPAGLDEGKGAKARVAEFEAQNAGKEVISIEESDSLQAIREAVYADADAGWLLGNKGRAEDSYFWIDRETGVKCRCRPDFVCDNGFILDLKTTTDVSGWSFGRTAYEYRYDCQSAFYWDGFTEVTGKVPQGFVFIAIEGKEEPKILVECYNVEYDTLDYGRSRYKESLRLIKKWQEDGHFPKKNVSGIKTLRLPKYANL